jgi:hypothetical protein
MVLISAMISSSKSLEIELHFLKEIQGDQKVSVQLMIIVKKRKNI